MKIYQNEQIGDIYRVLRGELEDSIDKFNTAIKRVEREFLKECASAGVYLPKDKDFVKYLDDFYLALDETDSIILSYYSPYDQKSYSITFTISPASKVSNSINFYEKMVEVLGYYSETLKEISYHFTIFSNFDTLKKAFIAFADL